MKKIVVVVLIVVAAVAALVVQLVVRPQPEEKEVPQLAEDIALYMQDQGLSKNMTVAIAVFAMPGFVVAQGMHEGEMGAVVGSTALLPSGRSENVRLMLERAPTEAEMFSAMLYDDTDGSGTFDVAVDRPSLDKAGNRVYAMFSTKAQ